jgi:hypothetical protein
MRTVDFEPLSVTVPVWEDPPGVIRVGKSRVLPQRHSMSTFANAINKPMWFAATLRRGGGFQVPTVT